MTVFVRRTPNPPRPRRIVFFRAVVGAALVLAPHPSVGQTVGVVASVNASAHSAPPGVATRPLSLGGDVVQRERIDTDANGTAQIAFADRSTMSVGRNASVVIDTFVYNPAQSAGAMAASLTKGALRFVGGQISHTNGASIRTPSATIGVRGGVATIVVSPGGQVSVIHHYGVTTVENAAGRQVLSRAGYETIVAGPNAAPSRAHPVAPGRLKQIMADMQSQGGQRGGAQTPPTAAAAARGAVGARRPDAETPNLDLPAALDAIARSHATTRPAPFAAPNEYSTDPCYNNPQC